MHEGELGAEFVERAGLREVFFVEAGAGRVPTGDTTAVADGAGGVFTVVIREIEARVGRGLVDHAAVVAGDIDADVGGLVGREQGLADGGLHVVEAEAGDRAECVAELVGALGEGAEGRGATVVGVAVEQTGLGVAAGPARDGKASAAVVEGVGAIDVDGGAVFGDVPDVGGFEEVIVVGLGLLVTQVEAGVDGVIFLGEDELGAVFSEPGWVDDFRIVVGRKRVALGVVPVGRVFEIQLGTELGGLDGLEVIFVAVGLVAGLQEAGVTVDFNRGAPGDGVAAAEHVFGVLRVGRRGAGPVVDVDTGDVIAVVDEVLGDAVDAPVLGVVSGEPLAVDEEFVNLVWTPGDRAVEGVGLLVAVDVVAGGVFTGVAEAVSELLGERAADVEGPAVGVVGAHGEADGAFGAVEVGALGDEVDETADIHRGALDRGGGAFDDVDGFDGVEVNGQAVAVRGDARADAVDEGVGRLTADAHVGGSAEVGRGEGAGGELREVQHVGDGDVGELLARDDGDVAWHIDDVVIGAEHGIKRTRRRQNLLLDRHGIDLEFLHFDGLAGGRGLRGHEAGQADDREGSDEGVKWCFSDGVVHALAGTNEHGMCHATSFVFMIFSDLRARVLGKRKRPD